MREQIKDALILGYQGEIARANANIEVYMRKSVGIGEHPDILAAIDSEIEKGYVDPFYPIYDLRIGSGWNTVFNETVNPFFGSLDNIQIWNIALSEEEITEYINCFPTGDC